MERQTCLLEELEAGLAFIFGNAVKGVSFATAGAITGYLAGDLRGLAIGAVVASVLGLGLF